MKLVLFYHSLVSDWNHGKAHFLRGVVSELLARDHEVVVYEPADGWSRVQLLEQHGTAPIEEFLIGPARRLGLRTRIHGVRYPAEALAALTEAGMPRGPYVKALPGIPTIRVFEALACGIPLVSAPWPDAEHLFAPGADDLVAQDGAQMGIIDGLQASPAPQRRSVSDA